MHMKTFCSARAVGIVELFIHDDIKLLIIGSAHIHVRTGAMHDVFQTCGSDVRFFVTGRGLVVYLPHTNMAAYVLIRVLFVSLVAYVCNSSPANVVLLLTDDQDLMLGGTTPMTFTNSFLQVNNIATMP